MHDWKLRQLILAIVATGFCGTALAAVPESQSPQQVLQPVRYDTSPPLSELIRIMEEKEAANPPAPTPPEYVVPNFDEPGNTATKLDKTLVGENPEGIQRGFNLGVSAPPVILSIDGIGQEDAAGNIRPPDTNGDVGPNDYIQYVNLHWQIYDKATGLATTPVMLGNTFWAGFGGGCETSNAGDPVVLYDKLAEQWVFTQFTGTGTNLQCFAISTGSDPAGPYHRYAYDFSPEFNDYPHLSIWTDAGGENSGYYLTTHDFLSDGMGGFNFQQASFSVVDRNAMLVGDPADIIRFTDTAFAGASSFGALSAHLESTELPPAGSCGPFVHNRADLDAYLYWELCPDWNNPPDSTLTGPVVVEANTAFDNMVDNVPQPPPAPAGSELDNFVGNTMFRVSARAYPDGSGLPVEMVLNHSSNAGDGVSGVRWVHMALPTGENLINGGFENGNLIPNGLPKILDQGLYSPDDDFRWMAGISIDQSRNIGVGYTVSSATTFPSVRYTGRTPGEPPGLLLDETSCVAGGGVQTVVDPSGRAGRWGDYSSMSIDPVDQCTFWLSVEYVAVTGSANWENRICSFRFPECGDPSFFISSDFDRQIDVCTLDDSPRANVNIQTLDFTDPVMLSASGVPGGVSVVFDESTISTLPGSTGFAINGLVSQGDSAFSFNVDAVSGGLTRSMDFDITTSTDFAAAPVLTAPADGSDTSVRPTFTWDAVSGALSYEIEFATDAGFTDIIDSVETTATTYNNQVFEADQTIFWRVRGLNNCGDGIYESASFTTVAPGVCPVGTTPNVVFSDDLESGATGWTTPASGTGTEMWALSDVRQNSGTFSFLAVDVATTSDQWLVSPSIVVPPIGQAPLTLSFWNYQNIEANIGTGVDACWDAGLLEVSTDAGSNWTQVEDALLLTDPYNGQVTVNGASPISGLFGWCADDIVPASGEQEVVSVVDITSLAGETVQFRYRLGTDGAVGDEGWYIDDVEVQGCSAP